MSVNLAQNWGTVGSFNNRNVAPKIICNLLTCRFSLKLNQNIFLVITLLHPITLILSQFCFLKQFPYENENYQLVCSDNFFLILIAMFIWFIWVYGLQIRQSADIEMNPGSKLNPCHSFSICHWNLNSLMAHNYLKVSLLRAYVAIKKFDVVCLLETFLDSSDYLMMTILIFPAITQSGRTIHQIQK